MMKKLSYLSIFITASFLVLSINAWSQEKGAITQGELTRLLGEKMGFKGDYLENLKKRGITPLGEWDEKKPLTKEDFDAVLIRMSRRDPVIENMEPAKLLDTMGFSPRGVSLPAVEAILRSDVFKMAVINLSLLLSPPALPLPLGYLPKVLGSASPTEAAIQVVAVVFATTAQEENIEPPPPPPPPPPDTRQNS